MHRNSSNLARLRSDLTDVVQRLNTTDDTALTIAAEYGVSGSCVGRLWRLNSTPGQRLAAWRHKRRHFGNAWKVQRDAEQIVHRLLNTPATIRQIAREYRCADGTICNVYGARTTHGQREAARLRKIAPSAKLHLFKKGQASWNKGKYVRLSRGTEFKKGCLRGMSARKWKPIGTIGLRRDKTGHVYAYVKIRDDGPPVRRWRLRSHIVWERERGPIPDGCRIIHADGDSSNDDPANLRCITNAEAVQWSHQRDPAAMLKGRKKAHQKARQRWEQYRQAKAAMKAMRPATPTSAVFDCRGCDYRVERMPADRRCPKCGGSAWSRTSAEKAKPKQLSVRERLLLELEDVAA